MLFNISAYSRLLLADFERRGGRIVTAELSGPEDFARLDEPTVINCTGYGARALLGDESLTPVRGQTAKLMPEPGLNYGLRSREAKVSIYPRRDGLLVQTAGENDFGDGSEALRPEESIGAVERLSSLVSALHG
jgi:glycine/D-amino acid oxidase-like deaminating enzyme